MLVTKLVEQELPTKAEVNNSLSQSPQLLFPAEFRLLQLDLQHQLSRQLHLHSSPHPFLLVLLLCVKSQNKPHKEISMQIDLDQEALQEEHPHQVEVPSLQEPETNQQLELQHHQSHPLKDPNHPHQDPNHLLPDRNHL